MTVTSPFFEINPRWYNSKSKDGLIYGVGPGFGYMSTTIKTPSKDYSGSGWTLQMGADIEYREGMFFVGAGTRMMWTQDLDLDVATLSVDNTLTQLKVGVNF